MMQKFLPLNKIEKMFLLLAFLHAPIGTAVFADVIWEGTQTSKSLFGSKKPIYVRKTTEGLELDGKFYHPWQLNRKQACAYGMTNFPELQMITRPRIKAWNKVLANINFIECKQISQNFRQSKTFEKTSTTTIR